MRLYFPWHINLLNHMINTLGRIKKEQRKGTKNRIIFFKKQDNLRSIILFQNKHNFDTGKKIYMQIILKNMIW